MWTNEQTAALIAAIEDDTLRTCEFNEPIEPHLNYGQAMKKCIFDLPRDWIAIAVKLKRTGKTRSHFISSILSSSSKRTSIYLFNFFFVFVILSP